PRKIVTAIVASGGVFIAKKASTTRTIPSIKKKNQSSRNDCANARRSSPQANYMSDLPRRCCVYAGNANMNDGHQYTCPPARAPTRKLVRPAAALALG